MKDVLDSSAIAAFVTFVIIASIHMGTIEARAAEQNQETCLGSAEKTKAMLSELKTQFECAKKDSWLECADSYNAGALAAATAVGINLQIKGSAIPDICPLKVGRVPNSPFSTWLIPVAEAQSPRSGCIPHADFIKRFPGLTVPELQKYVAAAEKELDERLRAQVSEMDELIKAADRIQPQGALPDHTVSDFSGRITRMSEEQLYKLAELVDRNKDVREEIKPRIQRILQEAKVASPNLKLRELNELRIAIGTNVKLEVLEEIILDHNAKLKFPVSPKQVMLELRNDVIMGREFNHKSAAQLMSNPEFKSLMDRMAAAKQNQFDLGLLRNGVARTRAAILQKGTQMGMQEIADHFASIPQFASENTTLRTLRERIGSSLQIAKVSPNKLDVAKASIVRMIGERRLSGLGVKYIAGALGAGFNVLAMAAETDPSKKGCSEKYSPFQTLNENCETVETLNEKLWDFLVLDFDSQQQELLRYPNFCRTIRNIHDTNSSPKSWQVKCGDKEVRLYHQNRSGDFDMAISAEARNAESAMPQEVLITTAGQGCSQYALNAEGAVSSEKKFNMSHVTSRMDAIVNTSSDWKSIDKCRSQLTEGRALAAQNQARRARAQAELQKQYQALPPEQRQYMSREIAETDIFDQPTSEIGSMHLARMAVMESSLCCFKPGDISADRCRAYGIRSKTYAPTQHSTPASSGRESN